MDGAWETKLLPSFEVVFSVDAKQLFFTFQSMKYMSPALAVDRVVVPGGDGPPKSLFSINVTSQAFKLLHVTDIMRWLVVPTKAIGPKHVFTLYKDYAGPHCIMLEQTSDAMVALKFNVSRKTTMTVDDMVRLLERFKQPPIESNLRSDIFAKLCAFLCRGDSAEYRDWFCNEALTADRKNPVTKVSEFTEMALEEMDPDDQGEFDELKDHLFIIP